MDAFSYNNIFETKGIEYLVIIAFLILLVPFTFILNKRSRNRAMSLKTNRNLSAESIEIPQGVFFSRYHTWTHLDRTGFAKVGIDDLLARLTGEVKISNFVADGDKIKKGDLVAELIQNDKILRIYSPISGEIICSNGDLEKNPELLTTDPYMHGWICKVKPYSWVTDTHSYFLAEEATQWGRQELSRFKDFLAESVAKISPDPSLVALQDGGELRENPLAELPKEVWQDFQQDFLSKKKPCRTKMCFPLQEETK
ncbi:MAG TPA: glycine cleavage system protein H [Prolixibacteraceae bacterium]|nr:glycine cleavage system protein H [Prolixibacteraceae bacterium]HPR85904.1 glycine cleavage system protein H [Prolixibacteraceae bacterium]